METEKMIAHIEKCIENATNRISKLTPEILASYGQSSEAGRHLLNNLCEMENN